MLTIFVKKSFLSGFREGESICGEKLKMPAANNIDLPCPSKYENQNDSIYFFNILIRKMKENSENFPLVFLNIPLEYITLNVYST